MDIRDVTQEMADARNSVDQVMCFVGYLIIAVIILVSVQVILGN
jgi:hypothetical protein